MIEGEDRSARYLAAYDTQLRGEAETSSAVRIERLGPLLLVEFLGGRGFITYGRPDEVTGAALAGLVPAALEHFRADPSFQHVEWKTRAHDPAPGLHDALTSAGFVAEESESIMIGEAAALAVEVPLPDGVTLRKVSAPAEVRAATAMQDEVFGDGIGEEIAESILQQMARGEQLELWIAESDGRIVSAGRVDPVPNSDFAGIWGGATREEWRGRGIYRALTSARARSALDMGKTLINSDSTEFSRPILERSGFVKVSSTTPYEWSRAAREA
jgi:GNAT superfamily N-acetyltransferase